MKEEAALKKELNGYEVGAAKAADAALRYEDQARRASSESTVNSALNSAKRERNKAIQLGNMVADATRRIGENAMAQESKRCALETAKKAHRLAGEREEQRRAQKEKSDRRARNREDERRRQREKAHAREVAKLSAPQVHFVHIRPPEPEKLRVLCRTPAPTFELISTGLSTAEESMAEVAAKIAELVRL